MRILGLMVYVAISQKRVFGCFLRLFPHISTLFSEIAWTVCPEYDSETVFSANILPRPFFELFREEVWTPGKQGRLPKTKSCSLNPLLSGTLGSGKIAVRQYPWQGKGKVWTTSPRNAKYMEESMVAATPSPETVAQWWEEYKADVSDQNKRNRLVENYLPLVRYHAQKVWMRLPDGVDLDDLTSAGVFGLMDAIDAFDLSRDVKFETYCAPRIRGAMLDELRNMDWVPRLVRTKAKKINEATKLLDDKLGRKPTEAEIADYLGISSDEFEKMSREANTATVVSLNKKLCETDGSKEVSELDVLEDQRGEDPTSRLQKIDTMRLVTKGLKRNERLILLLYYYQDMTMKEIGMTLDLSESRVSQIHSSIVQRLQGTLSERKPEFTS